MTVPKSVKDSTEKAKLSRRKKKKIAKKAAETLGQLAASITGNERLPNFNPRPLVMPPKPNK